MMPLDMMPHGPDGQGDGRGDGPGKAAPLQMLMLGLGEESFAIEAGMVREILDPVPMTAVAGSRGFVPALINVRGNVIPLADLRVRFGMPVRPATPDTRVVVIETAIDGDPVTLGIVADKVHEVIEVPPSWQQPTPRMGLRWPPELIRFVVKWKDGLSIVPDFQTILR